MSRLQAREVCRRGKKNRILKIISVNTPVKSPSRGFRHILLGCNKEGPYCTQHKTRQANKKEWTQNLNLYVTNVSSVEARSCSWGRGREGRKRGRGGGEEERKDPPKKRKSKSTHEPPPAS
jgi:hypothetical protein